jgi:hypothetical protein
MSRAVHGATVTLGSPQYPPHLTVCVLGAQRMSKLQNRTEQLQDPRGANSELSVPEGPSGPGGPASKPSGDGSGTLDGRRL